MQIVLTAYAVREVEVRFIAFLAEDDPVILKHLEDNNLTLEDLANTDGPVYLGDLWTNLLDSGYDVQIEEYNDLFDTTAESFIDFEVEFDTEEETNA